ncbi:hypothetical protein [Atopococcus tabaci]|uniref:hypothetical protein n=1 Tax=Atopococcus tabaci TaxID=269774 RepID=UPI0004826EE1|nr:hypothetical protein [Atopococcus tabaci]
MNNEQGMVLPSVMGILLIVTGLLTGTALSFRSQVQQLVLTQESYKIRSMIELAEKTLLETIENDEVNEMVVIFTEGRVKIERVEETVYQLTGKLPDGRHHSEQVDLAAVLQQENEGEKTVESETFHEMQEENEGGLMGGTKEKHEENKSRENNQHNPQE